MPAKKPEPIEEPLYSLWPKQVEALDLLGLGDEPPAVDELLFGGQAGPGKSFTVRAVAAAVADRKSTRLNSSHVSESRMPSSA